MIDYNAEARAVLARAMRNYGKALRSSDRKRDHYDTVLDKKLKESIRKLTGGKRALTPLNVLPRTAPIEDSK